LTVRLAGSLRVAEARRPRPGDHLEGCSAMGAGSPSPSRPTMKARHCALRRARWQRMTLPHRNSSAKASRLCQGNVEGNPLSSRRSGSVPHCRFARGPAAGTGTRAMVPLGPSSDRFRRRGPLSARAAQSAGGDGPAGTYGWRWKSAAGVVAERRARTAAGSWCDLARRRAGAACTTSRQWRGRVACPR
jgi:hypothetical protein